jgi:hypothetical protein
MNTILRSGRECLSAVARSGPVVPGIQTLETSRSMRSGYWLAIRSASCPFSATRTENPARSRILRSGSRRVASSSARRMVLALLIVVCESSTVTSPFHEGRCQPSANSLISPSNRCRAKRSARLSVMQDSWGDAIYHNDRPSTLVRSHLIVFINASHAIAALEYRVTASAYSRPFSRTATNASRPGAPSSATTCRACS